MKKQQITKELFKNWETKELKNYLETLGFKYPTQRVIETEQAIVGILEERLG
jgi:hypothetical protein